MSENVNPIATIETTKGEMTLELWKDVAPGTVDNFTKLANDGFYDGTCFHRIMAGFMIQGGDPQTKDQSLQDLWGTGGPGHTIKAEFSDRPHVRGVISMARSSNPDSAGSQFFICLNDANFLDGQYTAFGALSSGDNVLGDIGDTPVEASNSGENSKPKERIEVTSIRIT
jgi:peptidyl-prolyl cis-trans isomerase B (cyclophilin B)